MSTVSDFEQLFKLRQWCLHPEMVEQSEKRVNEPSINLEPNALSVQQKQALLPPSTTLQDPRIVEQSSGDESSPQTSEGLTGSYGSITGLAANKPADSTTVANPGLTPQSQHPDFEGNSTMPDGGLAVGASAGNNLAGPNSFLASSDQMELDQNFFQFFGSMNDLSDGDMTGFDNWASLPTDLLGLPDNFNWQPTSAADGSAPL